MSKCIESLRKPEMAEAKGAALDVTPISHPYSCCVTPGEPKVRERLAHSSIRIDEQDGLRYRMSSVSSVLVFGAWLSSTVALTPCMRDVQAKRLRTTSLTFSFPSQSARLREHQLLFAIQFTEVDPRVL